MTGQPTSYEIRVGGHLDGHWSQRLAGLQPVLCADGTTILVGTLADQAQLHGVLSALRDIGVELLGLRCVAPEAGGCGIGAASS